MWASVKKERRRGGVITLLPGELAAMVNRDKVVKDENGRFLAIPCRTLVKGQQL